MSAEGESLKDEMSQLLRADRERAQERRASAAAEPVPEPPAAPEQTPEQPRRRRFFR
jgi:hypothetical protein